jgi:hypothetical protein
MSGTGCSKKKKRELYSRSQTSVFPKWNCTKGITKVKENFACAARNYLGCATEPLWD